MSNTNGVTWREQCSGKERSHDISAADGPPPGTSSAGARAWVATLWLKWCPLVGFSTSASALMDPKPPSVLQTCWHGLKHTPGHTGVYIFIHTHTHTRGQGRRSLITITILFILCGKMGDTATGRMTTKKKHFFYQKFWPQTFSVVAVKWADGVFSHIQPTFWMTNKKTTIFLCTKLLFLATTRSAVLVGKKTQNSL